MSVTAIIAGVSALFPAVNELLKRFVPDVNARAAAQAEIEKLLISASTAQLEVNAKEATHASIFVAGWRPFIGWTCGAGCVYTFIAQPMLSWTSLLFGGPVLPVIDNGTLMGLLTGILGLGGLRTYEKVMDVAAGGFTKVVTSTSTAATPKVGGGSAVVTQYRD